MKLLSGFATRVSGGNIGVLIETAKHIDTRRYIKRCCTGSAGDGAADINVMTVGRARLWRTLRLGCRRCLGRAVLIRLKA